ncbi:hypothetical protein [Cytobacillus sp. BC1816]|uniref:hypothetical protein n=1 Tax=Cytobacillus sp. BC1816 TaxID=3440154 RepID=UPI003F50E96B
MKKGWTRLMAMAFIIISAITYYEFFLVPKNSLELYQEIAFAENFEEAQKIVLEGYENNFKEEGFEYINRADTSPDRISQFTLLEYESKTLVIMTSPGTEKLKVLAVEELPDELREYFMKLPQ